MAEPARLGWKTKLAYSPAAFAESMAINCKAQLVNPVFAIALGMNPALVGVALAIPRLWDAFTNPIVGSISDNWRGRWGRRRPFIFVGAILTGLSVAALWWAPLGRSESFYFWWLLVGGIIIAVFTDIFSVPYTAMGLELAEHRHDRTRLMAWRSFFSKLSGVGAQWLFKLVQLGMFAGAVYGARVVGIGVGLLIVALGILPAMLLKERVDLKIAPPKKVPLLASWRDTLRDGNFIFLAMANIGVYMSVLLVDTLGLYLSIYYVFGGDLSGAALLKGIAGTAFHVCGILSIPLISWLAGRLGKKNAFMLCTCSIVIGGVAKWFCFVPGASWWLILPSVLLAPGLVAVMVLVPSMLADLCEADARRTGARREGMYSAVMTWMFKLANSAVLFVSGFVLVAAGWDNEQGAVQTDETFFQMRLGFAGATILIALLSLLFIWRYRLKLGPPAYAISSAADAPA